MKAKLTKNGKLVIEPESELEDYALGAWWKLSWRELSANMIIATKIDAWSDDPVKLSSDTRQFRKARGEDLKSGVEILYLDGDYGPFIVTVEELLYSNDMFKAFIATDGCRYGLDGAYVEEIYDENFDNPE